MAKKRAAPEWRPEADEESQRLLPSHRSVEKRPLLVIGDGTVLTQAAAAAGVVRSLLVRSQTQYTLISRSRLVIHSDLVQLLGLDCFVRFAGFVYHKI